MPNYGGWELRDFAMLGDWRKLVEEEAEERHTLQAKSDYDAAHLAKWVSAFSNSEGGVLVLGVETKGAHDKIVAVPGTPNQMSPQRLQDIVREHVEPCPNLADYAVTSAEVESGRHAYAVFIPRSEGGPHQDRRTGVYWTVGTQGAMQMSDRQIRDAMGRGLRPALELTLTEGPGQVKSGQLEQSFRLSIVNRGRATARDVVVVIRRPEGVGWISPSRNECLAMNSPHPEERALEWRLPTSLPPQLERSTGLRFSFPAWKEGSPICFEVEADAYADGVPPLNRRWTWIIHGPRDLDLKDERSPVQDWDTPVELRRGWG